MAKMAGGSADSNMGSMASFAVNFRRIAEIARNPRKMTREHLCHVFAGCFSVLILTPMLFIVTDRRDPVVLQENASYLTPSVIVPGQQYSVTYKVMEHKACEGELSIRIIDSTGRIFPYAVEPTVYRKTYDPATRTFVKERLAPLDMAAGPATYTVTPRRWCNWFQQYIWPINSKSATINFIVVRPEPRLRP